MKKFEQWAEHERPLGIQLVSLAFAGILFLFLIPYTLLVPAPRLDVLLHLPRFFIGILNFIAGALLILVGGFFAIWSILTQVIKAKGTPLPMIPTQSLLIIGPFKYCRNPMAFGTILAYLGVAVIAGSTSSALIVLLFGGLLILYIKKIEEHELAARFGQAYLDYRNSTPFFIPMLRTKKSIDPKKE